MLKLLFSINKMCCNTVQCKYLILATLQKTVKTSKFSVLTLSCFLVYYQTSQLQYQQRTPSTHPRGRLENPKSTVKQRITGFTALSSNSREHAWRTKYHPVSFGRSNMLCYPSRQRMIKSWLLVPKTSDKEVNHSFPATTALSKASEGSNNEVYLATDVYCESAGS